MSIRSMKSTLVLAGGVCLVAAGAALSADLEITVQGA